MLMASLSPTVAARPVVIYGNANGLWSPTHPHLTDGRSKPNTPVRYVPPPIEETVVDTQLPKTCPTLQSAPHLCQDS